MSLPYPTYNMLDFCNQFYCSIYKFLDRFGNVSNQSAFRLFCLSHAVFLQMCAKGFLEWPGLNNLPKKLNACYMTTLLITCSPNRSIIAKQFMYFEINSNLDAG